MAAVCKPNLHHKIDTCFGMQARGMLGACLPNTVWSRALVLRPVQTHPDAVVSICLEALGTHQCRTLTTVIQVSHLLHDMRHSCSRGSGRVFGAATPCRGLGPDHCRGKGGPGAAAVGMDRRGPGQGQGRVRQRSFRLLVREEGVLTGCCCTCGACSACSALRSRVVGTGRHGWQWHVLGCWA